MDMQMMAVLEQKQVGREAVDFKIQWITLRLLQRAKHDMS